MVALHVSARLRLKATPLLLSIWMSWDLKFTVDECSTHLRAIFETVSSRQGSMKNLHA